MANKLVCFHANVIRLFYHWNEACQSSPAGFDVPDIGPLKIMTNKLVRFDLNPLRFFITVMRLASGHLLVLTFLLLNVDSVSTFPTSDEVEVETDFAIRTN